MAYKIVASQCTVCGACEFECPNAAISLKRDMYVIDPKKCTECEGHFDTHNARSSVRCPTPAFRPEGRAMTQANEISLVAEQ